MFDPETLVMLRDVSHPPRLIYSPMILSTPDQIETDTEIPPFTANGLEPVSLNEWEPFVRSDGSEAMGSNVWARVVGEDIAEPLLAGCRVIQIWSEGAWRNIYVDQFEQPVKFNRGFPIERGRVMITQYAGADGPLFKWEVIPLFTKRRR